MKNSAIIAICAGLMMSACSTTSPNDKNDKQGNIESKVLGLSAQDLAEGECGAFLWAETKPRQFVYFQKQDAPAAQFYNDGRSRTLTTTDATSYLVDAGKLELNYKDTDGESVVVKGTYGEEIEGGYRISPATISVNPTNGWQQIIPTSGVFICR